MLSGTNLKTFLRNLLPPSLRQKSKQQGKNRVRCRDKKDKALQASRSETVRSTEAAANTSKARNYVQERGKEYFSENVRGGGEGCMVLAGVTGHQ
jgi:hypothetical protein